MRRRGASEPDPLESQIGEGESVGETDDVRRVTGVTPFFVRSPTTWLVVFGVLAFVGLSLFLGSDKDERVGGVSMPARKTDSDAFDRTSVTRALDGAQSIWMHSFAARGEAYRPARLAFFDANVSAPCPFAGAPRGLFYCSRDERVYVELTFLENLRTRLGANAGFAVEYVLAHEIGHHVQHLRGMNRSRRAKISHAEVEGLSSELQADCYAGIWAHATRQVPSGGASAITEVFRNLSHADEEWTRRLPAGAVKPETWTSSSVELRAQWFEKGASSGDMDACDTRP